MLFAILALALFACAARAEIALPAGPKTERTKKQPLAPQAIEATLQVSPGATGQVSLRVTGKRNQTVRYLIRSEPKLGKIVSVQPSEAEVSVLTYQHTAPMVGGGDMHDRIVFAAQDSNGTSAPEEVAITIVDDAPVLVAPDTVDFGEVLLNATASRTITIANRGGRVLEGDFGVEAPWQIEPPHYRLGRGEAERFHVSLAPDFEQEYRGLVRFPGQGETILHAVARAPVTIAPLSLELAGKGDSKQRLGNLTLSNRTAVDQKVQVDADPRLHLPAEIVVPANGTNTVSAMLAADDAEGIDATVEFQNGSVIRKITIHGPPSGPSLVTDSTALAFGKMEVGRTKLLRFHLENRGGSPANLTAEVPPPFQVEPRSAVVAPGKGADLLVQLDPAWPGMLSANLTVQAADAHLKIPVNAEVVPRSAMPRIISQDAGPGAGTGSQLGVDSPGQVIQAKPGVYSTIPPIGLIDVTQVTPTTATLCWKPPGNGKTELKYKLEFRRSLLDPKGVWHIEWLPIPDVEFKLTPEQVTARLIDLPSGYALTVRALSVTPKGQLSQPSAPVQFFIPFKPVIFTVQRVLLVIFGLMSVVALRLRKLQR